MKKHLWVLLSALCIGFGGAQIEPIYWGFIYNNMGLVNFAQLQLDQLEAMNPSRREAQGLTRTPQVSWAYRPDPQVSAQVRAQFAEHLVRTAQASGTQAQQLRQGVEQAFTPANLSRLAQELFPREKFAITDMADATAMLVIGCFFVVQRMEQGTLEQNLGVREQFRVALGRTPALAQMSDAQKQRHAESSMILLAVLLNEYQQWQQGTPGYTREGVENLARQLLVLMTLDPSRYRLGSRGLERR
ncbi:MAG: hypothetical protein N2318_01440 [Meiothermus sp.]|nr:hypothetical protein [Meiothermus sp.]